MIEQHGLLFGLFRGEEMRLLRIDTKKRETEKKYNERKTEGKNCDNREIEEKNTIRNCIY